MIGVLGLLLSLQACEARTSQRAAQDVARLEFVLELSDPEGAIAAEARAAAVNRAVEIIRERLDRFRVRRTRVRKIGDERIAVELPGLPEPERARAKRMMQEMALLEFRIVESHDTLIAVLPRLDSLIVSSLPAGDPGSPRTSLLLTELLILSAETGVLLVEEPNVETVDRFLRIPTVESAIPSGIRLVWSTESLEHEDQLYRPLYALAAEPVLTSEYFADAVAHRSSISGRSIVSFELTREGAEIFEGATSQHIGDRMAIVLDGKVQGAPPVIRSAIRAHGPIELSVETGVEEARDLAILLSAGPLPGAFVIVEERPVGEPGR